MATIPNDIMDSIGYAILGETGIGKYFAREVMRLTRLEEERFKEEAMFDYYINGRTVTVDWGGVEVTKYEGFSPPAIKRIIISTPENPVATIFFWGDGDKTVVKTMEGDEYNFETALHQAIIEKFVFENKKTQKNNFLHRVMKAYHYNLDNEGHIEDFIDSKYTSCPWCSREVATEKDFSGEVECDECENHFSINKNGLSKKL